MTTIEELSCKIEMLNKKLDDLNKKFEMLMQKVKKEETETNWDISEYKNSILVSFSFNKEFKEYVKELGGKWMVTKKAWMFPKSNEIEIINNITEKFPTWNFTKNEKNEL